jgi:hypothetical protein
MKDRQHTPSTECPSLADRIAAMPHALTGADLAKAAKELHDLLQPRGVWVWFSEKDIGLGTPFLREIDRGLAKSKVGIVLVTPALERPTFQ